MKTVVRATLLKAGAGGSQQRLDVFHHARGLFLDAAFDQLTRNRIEWNRSGQEEQVADLESGRIRAQWPSPRPPL
jgi:hypothetical protein